LFFCYVSVKRSAYFPNFSSSSFEAEEDVGALHGNHAELLGGRLLIDDGGDYCGNSCAAEAEQYWLYRSNLVVRNSMDTDVRTDQRATTQGGNS
jgi:hypothetical protein